MLEWSSKALGCEKRLETAGSDFTRCLIANPADWVFDPLHINHNTHDTLPSPAVYVLEPSRLLCKLTNSIWNLQDISELEMFESSSSYCLAAVRSRTRIHKQPHRGVCGSVLGSKWDWIATSFAQERGPAESEPSQSTTWRPKLKAALHENKSHKLGTNWRFSIFSV